MGACIGLEYSFAILDQRKFTYPISVRIMWENGLVYFYNKSFMFGLAFRPPNFKSSVWVEAGQKMYLQSNLSNTSTIYLPKINKIVYSDSEAIWQIIARTADQSGKLSERLPGHVLVFCQMSYGRSFC